LWLWEVQLSFSNKLQKMESSHLQEGYTSDYRGGKPFPGHMHVLTRPFSCSRAHDFTKKRGKIALQNQFALKHDSHQPFLKVQATKKQELVCT
jgi:hypothetical protein